MVLTSAAALERLQEGNRRFVNGVSAESARSTKPADTVLGQTPFATILGCSDSRVPAEIVFDQGLGDLFVIRIAGNIVAASQIGSVEFAATSFGSPLVVVLGHSGCGAVQVAVEELTNPPTERSRNLQSIVDLIKPSVETALRSAESVGSEGLVELAVRENIHRSVEHLRHGSEILESMLEAGRLAIVGAEYSLQTGEVVFFSD